LATIKFPGLKEYEKRLSTLGKEGKAIAEKAVYAGAAIIADASPKSARSSRRRFGKQKKRRKKRWRKSSMKKSQKL